LLAGYRQPGHPLPIGPGAPVGRRRFGNAIEHALAFRVLVCQCAITALYAVVLGLFHTNPVCVVVFTAMAGYAVVGIQAGLNALSAEIYPTSIRATGAGWALAVGRLGSISWAARVRSIERQTRSHDQRTPTLPPAYGCQIASCRPKRRMPLVRVRCARRLESGAHHVIDVGVGLRGCPDAVSRRRVDRVFLNKLTVTRTANRQIRTNSLCCLRKHQTRDRQKGDGLPAR
jgi:hypothetical protein